MNKLTILNEINELLNHPALTILSSNTVSREQMQIFASQYYYVSKAFPKIIAVALSSVENYECQFEFIQNLWDEYGSGDENRDHRKNVF